MKIRLLSKSLLLSGLFVFLLASCQEEDAVAPIQQDDMLQLMTIEETLVSYTEQAESAEKEQSASRWGKKRPTYRTLTVALARTRLLSTVLRSELTLLAPSDEAFAELGIYPWNVGKVDNLKDILLYHAIGGKVKSTDLTEGFVQTVNGASVNVSLDGGVFFDDAQVTKADVHTKRGVIHFIDGVLIPPTKSLLELVQGDDRFTILEQAVITAELDGALANPDANFTVFAPTDDAFIALLGELGIGAGDLLSSPALANVLLYHVLSGRVFSTDLSDGLTVAMENGEDITFDLSGLPSIIDVNGRSIPLNTGNLNIQATNGVVHVIDAVLAPAALAPLLP